MSGGMFEYKQYHINDIVDVIEKEIKDEQFHDALNMEFNGDEIMKQKIVEEFNKGLYYLKMASIYAQRIDWVLSGDDGFKTFLNRINEDIKEHNENH